MRHRLVLSCASRVEMLGWWLSAFLFRFFASISLNTRYAYHAFIYIGAQTSLWISFIMLGEKSSRKADARELPIRRKIGKYNYNCVGRNSVQRNTSHWMLLCRAQSFQYPSLEAWVKNTKKHPRTIPIVWALPLIDWLKVCLKLN